MSKCDNCCIRKECATAFDIHWLGKDDCPYDKCPFQTNADRIRAMTDEELARFMSKVETNGRVFGLKGIASWLKWLKQETDG